MGTCIDRDADASGGAGPRAQNGRAAAFARARQGGSGPIRNGGRAEQDGRGAKAESALRARYPARANRTDEGRAETDARPGTLLATGRSTIARHCSATSQITPGGRASRSKWKACQNDDP